MRELCLRSCQPCLNRSFCHIRFGGLSVGCLERSESRRSDRSQHRYRRLCNSFAGQVSYFRNLWRKGSRRAVHHDARTGRRRSIPSETAVWNPGSPGTRIYREFAIKQYETQHFYSTFPRDVFSFLCTLEINSSDDGTLAPRFVTAAAPTVQPHNRA